MKPEEYDSLKKAYAEISEEELIDLFLVPPEEFEAGVYDIVVQEIKTRELEDVIAERQNQVVERDHSHDIALVTIAQFSTGPEAHVAKTKLESEGIECFIADEHLISINWLLSNAIGGVKLQVRSSDAEKAQSILSQRESE